MYRINLFRNLNIISMINSPTGSHVHVSSFVFNTHYKTQKSIDLNKPIDFMIQ